MLYCEKSLNSNSNKKEVEKIDKGINIDKKRGIKSE